MLVYQRVFLARKVGLFLLRRLVHGDAGWSLPAHLPFRQHAAGGGPTEKGRSHGWLMLLTRWFKVTFWSPSWRSLNLSKRSLNHPKRVTLNHQVGIVYTGDFFYLLRILPKVNWWFLLVFLLASNWDTIFGDRRNPNHRAPNHQLTISWVDDFPAIFFHLESRWRSPLPKRWRFVRGHDKPRLMEWEWRSPSTFNTCVYLLRSGVL